jgi:hypothetical protein
MIKEASHRLSVALRDPLRAVVGVYGAQADLVRGPVSASGMLVM